MNNRADLGAPLLEDRLAALRALVRGRPGRASAGREVNCHVHTFYSFSPYSPAAAAARAQDAGLAAVGIMDHDSIAGAAEMRQAGRILGIATTAGIELRVSAAGTPLAGRKINNPDSPGVLYMMIHGIPARSIGRVTEFLRPIRASREKRDRLMVERLNSLLPGFGLAPLDWERDVRGASRADEGGSVTERHILSAVARAILSRVGGGPSLPAFVRDRLGISAPPRVAGYLADQDNEHLLYDLLGVLKSSFIDKIFIQPDGEECIPVAEGVRLAEEAGGIPCYGYLGDITDSPTGDKKAERFEDAYLDELLEEAVRLGFRAVAYMPPRNTREQLLRVQRLCARLGLMEISGVDINSPRQSFNCPELLLPEFSHLIGATWALIAHERLADEHPRYGLFHPENPLAAEPLDRRIAAYAEVGHALDPSDDRPARDHPLVRNWR